jgi:hypothetical protein
MPGNDEAQGSRRLRLLVTPAKAGVQFFFSLDSGLRRNDENAVFFMRYRSAT